MTMTVYTVITHLIVLFVSFFLVLYESRSCSNIKKKKVIKAEHNCVEVFLDNNSVPERF